MNGVTSTRCDRTYHMAGSRTPLAMTPASIEQLITSAGRVPVERDTFYNRIN